MSPRRKIKAELGELLIENKILRPEELEEALNLQHTEKYRGKRIGEILVELGYVKEEELYSALATQLGYPYIKISNCKIDSDVLNMVPKKMAENLNVMPIDKIGYILTLAMLNPLEEEAIEKIEKITGLKVKIFVTTLSELKEAQLVNYGTGKSK
jgi:type IV pilus assembly protein PilB